SVKRSKTSAVKRSKTSAVKRSKTSAVKRSKTSAEATPSRTFRGRLLALFSPSANWSLVRVAATAAAAVLVIAVTSVLLIDINTSKAPSNPPTGLTGSATHRGPLVIANGAGGPVTVDRRGRAKGVDDARVLAVVENIEAWRPSVPESLIAEARTVRSPAGATLSLDSFSPEGTVVLSDRPTFKWPVIDEAKGYIVEIYELTQDNETKKKAAASALLSKTEWTVPSALSRGVAYAWQVIGVRADESLMDPQPGSSDEKLRFKVLEKSKADELEIAKRKDANAHLTLGILYTEAGLIEDAEREFEELLRANRESPDAQKFARKLLDRVKEMRTR
ncbi:MAG: hypothetical protein L0229_19965, partial [Blastocatellia bacterium]|nr:hypothetical protein [Blastocatellia bacterium]